MTSGAMMDEAAGFLNDSSKTVYTYAVMLPYAKRAYRRLQLKMHLSDASALLEASAVFSIAANITNLDAEQISVFPDLIEPISMEERLSGSSDLFTPMDRREFEPDVNTASDRLNTWTWREDRITFNLLGASTARELKLKYLKSGASLVDQNSNITIINADLFMSPMIASYCERYIKQNSAKADSLEREALSAIDEIIRLNVKKRQRLSVRRRSFSRWLRTG